MAKSESLTGMVVLERSHLKIIHYEELDLVELIWKGYIPSKEYRAGLESGLALAKEKGIKHWLADLRQMGVILLVDEKWTNEDWFPRMARSGVERMAILRSSDFFNDMSVERMMSGAAEVVSFEVAYFTTREQGLEWLLASGEGG